MLKKKIITLLGAIAVCGIAACSGTGNNDSVAAADSANEAKMSADTGQAVASATPVSEDDSKFAVEAANGGMAEVALGQLAQEKSSDPKVKEFAAMMVADHSRVNDELKTLAASKNITLPAAPGEKEQKVKDGLSKRTGKDFDKAYIDEMLDDHEHDVKAFEDARDKVKDPEIHQFIEKTLPVLKMHLEHVQAIHKQMK